MADCEPSGLSKSPTGPRTKRRGQTSELDLLVDNLRGVPDETPALPEALALRDAGWRLVVAYCRISNDRHRKDGHGVSDQAQHCARIAARHRMIIVHRYVDNDRSASKVGVQRPDFDAMLIALRNGASAIGYPVDGVVCVSDDRLYRDVGTCQRFLQCFIAHPSRAYADDFGSYDLYNEDSARRSLLGAAAARAESAKQQHRARLSHRARAERGEPVSTRRPFGWNADRLTLHPGESEVVRRGVHGLLAGETLTAVAQGFATSGYPTSLGNPWQRQTVKQLLRNPRLCGYRELGGVLVCDGDGEPVIGRWEPIVSHEEWRRVTRLLGGQRHAGGWHRQGPDQSKGAPYLLTGLVRCGRPLPPDGQPCGASMHGHPTRTSHEYRCRSALDGGCGRLSRQGRAVDDLITEYALSELERRYASAPTIAPWPGARELALTTRRKTALQEQWHEGEISDSVYFRLLAEEEVEIKRLANDQRNWPVRNRPGLRENTEVRADWARLATAARHTVLRSLLDSVIILLGVKGSHRFDPTLVIPVWRTMNSPATSV
ncbi:recombinase family protein [Streptomyces fuscichromogenes]|uniref:Integrase n=1 Tax=Streptomyces fuscichromogenes TaxID=1324013 RepID=A0A917XHW6_9ACTN|nr:recombinase family protein [Streptomyces fuscichromogenes]GGN28283.1 integrase [Streptomyces fuscichromogenes]